MSDAPTAEPRRTYYVHTRAARRHGRSCHEHRVFGAGHELVARGYLHRTFQPSPVAFGGDPERPDVVIQLRKSFPLTGKVDLRDAQDGALLGVAPRGHQLYDANDQRLARFENAEPSRPVGRALAQLALDAALGSDGVGSAPASQHFALTRRGQALGSLRRGQLPFFPDSPARRQPSRLSHVLQHLVPAKLRDTWRSTPPRGWVFELNAADWAIDDRTLLCFVLTTIEIRNWQST